MSEPREDHNRILYRLREMFGEDRARTFSGNRFRVAGEDTRVVAFPDKIEELSEMLQLAASERWRVIPAGAGSWLEMGNRPLQFHLLISTSRMSRILEYEPADLTATLQAGCPLTTFNKIAAEHKQFIPLDPFGDEEATIGGIISTGSSGPLRCAYGTPRDWLIGIQVAHADGRMTRAGGKVVKNVAGYDLCKLYTGSYGTLGIVTEMSFKLRSLPPDEKTLVFYSQDAGRLCALVSDISDSDIQPAACELFSSDPGLPVETGPYTLALRFLNQTETIETQINEALNKGPEFGSAILNNDEAREMWKIYRESEISERWNYILKMSVLPSKLSAALDELADILPGSHWRAHAANGVVRILAESGWLETFKTRERARKIAELRHRAQSHGGQLTIVRASDDILEQLDVWGEVGETAGLMRAIKEKFDPQSMLNPGRFVAGI